jgi:hypothetical protein
VGLLAALVALGGALQGPLPGCPHPLVGGAQVAAAARELLLDLLRLYGALEGAGHYSRATARSRADNTWVLAPTWPQLAPPHRPALPCTCTCTWAPP